MKTNEMFYFVIEQFPSRWKSYIAVGNFLQEYKDKGVEHFRSTVANDLLKILDEPIIVKVGSALFKATDYDINAFIKALSKAWQAQSEEKQQAIITYCELLEKASALMTDEEYQAFSPIITEKCHTIDIRDTFFFQWSC